MRIHKGKEIHRQGQNKVYFLKYLGTNRCGKKLSSSTPPWLGNEGHDTAKFISAFTMILVSSSLYYLASNGFNMILMQYVLHE